MKIVIMGAGGHGRVVLDILQHHPEFKVIGFLDSDKKLHGKNVDGIPVLGGFSFLSVLIKKGTRGIIIAIGDNQARADFARRIKRKYKGKIELINAIHPTATIAKNACLGKGVVVAAGAIICAHAKIGNNVVVNTGAIVEHENIIEDNVHLSPGVRLAGRVRIKKGAHIGIGSTIIEMLTIGENSIVGAGSVVIKDISSNVTAVGIPTKVIKKRR